MTLEDWAALDEDVEGELVDGRLVEEEMPSFVHEAVVSWLIRVLGAHFVPRGGFVLGSEFKVAIGPRRGRKGDTLVFMAGRPRPAGAASMTRTPPDIVVEVVTPTPRDARRDRVDKRADYAAAGVRRYWVIDPEVRVVEALQLGPDGRYVEALVVSGGQYEVPGCDGFVLDVDAMWSEADRAASAEDTGAAD